jgi:hypothetical protein
VLVLLFAFGSSLARAQQTATTSPPAAATEGAVVLQKALAALAPTTRITDVTLSGTARRIAGSDDESGTVALKALAGTGSRIDLNFPSGPRTETRNTSGEPVGSWSGPDGVSHPAFSHNVLTDPGWFPAFTLASLITSQNAVITYIGPETKSGTAVIHLAASRQYSDVPGDIAPLMHHLTEVDIFLDANSYLPAAVTFNIHADDNARLDIPVEIDFSNYQNVSGVQIPFHIQKLINNSLALDLKFESAVLNSGLSATSFADGAGL